MKRDLAERLAATANHEVPVEQAKAIIAAFLTALARCAVCDGTGTFTFTRETTTESRGGKIVVPAGTVSDCPRCGGTKNDPDFVGWHCVAGDYRHVCEVDKRAGNGRQEAHAICGLRVMIPLPGTDQA